MNISQRRPVWIALSDFYLDTELQPYDFMHIAKVIKESPYSLTEVKKINRYEVFPVLWINLISVAGESSGFDAEWLVKTITESLEKRTKFKDSMMQLVFRLLKGRFADYWDNVESCMRE